VAFSRVSRLEDLHIVDFDERSIIVSENVKALFQEQGIQTV
jgi:hypothetical protein